MAGGIAFELGNPLAVVSSAAQLLHEKPLSPAEVQECVAKIIRGVQRMTSVLDSLLRFARPSWPATPGPIDLVGVLEDARPRVANQLWSEDIELYCRVEVRPLWVEGYLGLLQQLLNNLLLEAANAIGCQRGRIDLSLEAQDRWAVLRVHDTGKGIPPGSIPDVFDPFFTTLPPGEGHGLGLSICYAIVQQHGGTLELSSEPGRGTLVTVRLPWCDPADKP
jgi:two-component system NtrC family sensor kinase